MKKERMIDYYIDGFIGYLHKLTFDLGLPGFEKIWCRGK